MGREFTSCQLEDIEKYVDAVKWFEVASVTHRYEEKRLDKLPWMEMFGSFREYNELVPEKIRKSFRRNVFIENCIEKYQKLYDNMWKRINAKDENASQT